MLAFFCKFPGAARAAQRATTTIPIRPGQIQTPGVLHGQVVTDMSAVLDEAWELVKHGMIAEADFREFAFENAESNVGGQIPLERVLTSIRLYAQEVAPRLP